MDQKSEQGKNRDKMVFQSKRNKLNTKKMGTIVERKKRAPFKFKI